VTSAISPATRQDTTRARCAAATFTAHRHASLSPSSARSAAASAARSAADPATCRTVTAVPIASTTAKAQDAMPMTTTAQTDADPRSRSRAPPGR
jgi:hypothetical protein